MIRLQFEDQSALGVIVKMKDFLQRCSVTRPPGDVDDIDQPDDTDEVAILRGQISTLEVTISELESELGIVNELLSRREDVDPGWLAMQKLLRITGWDFPRRSGDQLGFGAISRGSSFAAWYIEAMPNKYKVVERMSLKKGTTLEQAIIDFVALNPDLQAKWDAD